MKKFEDLKIGDCAEFKHKITTEDVKKFVELTGDDNPLHVDREFAEQTSFGGVVTHGMLSASFVSTMIGKYIPGNGALWVSQNFEFLLPVRIGDVLSIQSEVTEIHFSQRILTLKTIINNQHKQAVLQGIGKIKALETKSTDITSQKMPQSNVVIITGASKGIGAATARYLAKKQYKVVVNYSEDNEGAESVVNEICKAGGDAFAYQADVRDMQSVENMVKKTIQNFGTVSALVHSASTKIIPSEFHALVWSDIQQHIDVQLQGAFNCIQAVLREFCEAKRGTVVMLGSVVTDNVPSPKWTGYTLAKASLHSLTKSLALEYGPKGIRFNMVSPGMTETGLIVDIPEKAKLLSKMSTPLRKHAQPNDIASAIAFLLSDEAHHITGENLRVCGGVVML